MKISELISDFKIFTSNEENEALKKLHSPVPLNSLTEREQFVVENLIKKGLVIKINDLNPMVIANEFD